MKQNLKGTLLNKHKIGDLRMHISVLQLFSFYILCAYGIEKNIELNKQNPFVPWNNWQATQGIAQNVYILCDGLAI